MLLLAGEGKGRGGTDHVEGERGMQNAAIRCYLHKEKENLNDTEKAKAHSTYYRACIV